MQILISDEFINGSVSNQFQLDLDSEVITAEKLIEKRVVMEVENYNNNVTKYFRGLVQPQEAETTLNGYKLKAKKKIDLEKQIYVALGAFQRNGFFILVDDRQIEDLNEKIILKNNSKVSFVKLVPLVGG